MEIKILSYLKGCQLPIKGLLLRQQMDVANCTEFDNALKFLAQNYYIEISDQKRKLKDDCAPRTYKLKSVTKEGEEYLNSVIPDRFKKCFAALTITEKIKLFSEYAKSALSIADFLMSFFR